MYHNSNSRVIYLGHLGGSNECVNAENGN